MLAGEKAGCLPTQVQAPLPVAQQADADEPVPHLEVTSAVTVKCCDSVGPAESFAEGQMCYIRPTVMPRHYGFSQPIAASHTGMLPKSN